MNTYQLQRLREIEGQQIAIYRQMAADPSCFANLIEQLVRLKREENDVIGQAYTVDIDRYLKAFPRYLASYEDFGKRYRSTKPRKRIPRDKTTEERRTLYFQKGRA